MELEGRAMQMSCRRSRTREEEEDKPPLSHMIQRRPLDKEVAIKVPETAILCEMKKRVPAGLAMVLSQAEEGGEGLASRGSHKQANIKSSPARGNQQHQNTEADRNDQRLVNSFPRSPTGHLGKTGFSVHKSDGESAAAL